MAVSGDQRQEAGSKSESCGDYGVTQTRIVNDWLAGRETNLPRPDQASGVFWHGFYCRTSIIVPDYVRRPRRIRKLSPCWTLIRRLGGDRSVTPRRRLRRLSPTPRPLPWSRYLNQRWLSCARRLPA